MPDTLGACDVLALIGMGCSIFGPSVYQSFSINCGQLLIARNV